MGPPFVPAAAPAAWSPPAAEPSDATIASEPGFFADAYAPAANAPYAHVPERAGTPAPLPPPPLPGSALPLRAPTDNSFTGTDSRHPRAPSDWIADRAPDARASSRAGDATGARRDPTLDAMQIAEPLRIGGGLLGNRKLLAIIAGGVVLLVVVIIAATRGGSTTKRAQHAAAQPEGQAPVVAENHAGSAAAGDDDNAHAPTAPPSHGHAAVAQNAAPGKSPSPTGVAPAAAGNLTPAAPETPSAGSAESEPAPAPEPPPAPREPPAPRHHPTIGGKKVVLEYDTPTHEAPKTAPAVEEDAGSVARARASYAAGNKRLFAGDAAGAVRAYEQALAAYPGYVAGYRGLGLAYTQQGDKAKALRAFHTYLSSVPGAKDAPLIRKRVTALSH